MLINEFVIRSSFTDNASGGVMGSMLASNAVGCWFETPSGQTKDYKIGTWDFSAKHVAVRSKSKDRLARK